LSTLGAKIGNFVELLKLIILKYSVSMQRRVLSASSGQDFDYALKSTVMMTEVLVGKSADGNGVLRCYREFDSLMPSHPFANVLGTAMPC
jgi:hypothetical protein